MVTLGEDGPVMSENIAGSAYPVVATTEELARDWFKGRPEENEVIYHKMTAQEMVDTMMSCKIGGMTMLNGKPESYFQTDTIQNALDIINRDGPACVTEYYFFHVTKTTTQKYM